jgi:hypothetical protein
LDLKIRDAQASLLGNLILINYLEYKITAMKKIISFAFLFFFIIPGVGAKIWRVNNTGVPADFTTAQAAHDGAAAGDTLHFEPSPTSYGNLSMSKKLVLIGVGDFLDINLNNQATNVPAQLGAVVVNSGAAGSTIMITAQTVNILSAQDVVIQRCYVINTMGSFGSGPGIRVENANNTVIRNCFSVFGIDIIGTCINTQVINNIVGQNISMSTSSSTATILNNVINGRITANSNLYNSTFRNNIINKAGTFSCGSCVIENNLSSTSSLPAGNGNQNSVNMTTVFIDPNNYIDSTFKLKSGSPAIGAGIGGIDAGAYGGLSPYHLSMQPNVPAIYKLVAPAVVTGGTITITISTKSNN